MIFQLKIAHPGKGGFFLPKPLAKSSPTRYYFPMSSYVKRKEKESFEGMIRRFRRMVMMSKTLTEAKDRRFNTKPITKDKRRDAAVRKERIRAQRKKDMY